MSRRPCWLIAGTAPIALLLCSVSSCRDCTVCPPQVECPEVSADGWIPLTKVPTTRHVNGVHAIDAVTVVAVGDSGAVLRTTDAGSTWTLVPLPTAAQFMSLSFISRRIGWTAGTDGGATGLFRTSGTTAPPRGIAFANAGAGWIVDQRGTILRKVGAGKIRAL